MPVNDDGFFECGRLLYVDPTNISFEGQNPQIDRSSTKIFNPLEEYSIGVDLIVRLSERHACGIGEYTNQSNHTIEFTTANKSISFFKGSRKNDENYLTTEYTDINLVDPVNNSDECLGIESISIEYESWNYPIVRIKFIDVRGAAVFSRAELNLNNSSDGDDDFVDNKVMLYRSFFSFPYPLFILKVKGFYGRGATFYLTIEDVNLNFDSASGNFEINAKFIGMMYRIYTDIPMVYVCVAPYMAMHGSAHWDNMVSNKIFSFKDENGNYQADMIKFPELADKLNRLEFNQELIDLNNEKTKYSEEVDTRTETLQRLKSPVIENSFAVNDTKNNKCYLLILSTEKYEDNAKSVVIDYIKKITDYDTAYGTNFGSICPSLIEHGGDDVLATIKYKYSDRDGKATPNNANEAAKYIPTSGPIYKTIQKQSQNSKTFQVHVLPIDFGYLSKMKNAATEQEEMLNQEKTNKENEFKKNNEELTEKILGFKPSIKNMYDLAFAHMDTFIFAYNEMLKHIHTDMENGLRDRNLLDVGDSDIPNNEHFTTIPPFPSIYGETNAGWDNKITTQKVEKWLEDIPGFSEFQEVEFVNDLQNAACLYTDKMEEVRKTREELEAKANSSGETEQREYATKESSEQYTFIPSTHYDLNHVGVSPYCFLKTLYQNDSEDAISSSLFVFLNRAFYFLLRNPKNKTTAESFGLIEAYNFYCGVGKPNSTQVSEFVNVLTGMNSEDIIKLAVEQPNISDKKTCSWANLGSKGNFSGPLFEKTGENKLKSKLRNTQGGRRPIPIANFDPISVKSDMGDSVSLETMAQNSDILLTSELGVNGINLSGNTFVIVNNGRYLKDIEQNMQVKIQNISEYDNTQREKTEFLYKTGSYSSYMSSHGFPVDNINILVDEKSNSVEFLKAIHRKDKTYILKSPTNLNPTFQNSKPATFIYQIGKTIFGLSDYDMMNIELTMKTGTYPLITVLIAGLMANGYIISEDSQIISKDKYNTPRQKALKEFYLEWSKKNNDIIEKYILNYSKFIQNNGGHNESGNFNIKAKIGDNVFENIIQKPLRDVLLTTVCVIDYASSIHYLSDSGMKYHNTIQQDMLSTAFASFTSGLKKFYENYSPAELPQPESKMGQDMLEQFENRDIKLSTYLTLKTLYDKWLCAPYKGPDTWNMSSPNSDFNSFVYIDTIYNDIGLSLTVNVTSINERIAQCMPTSESESEEGRAHWNNVSVYQYLSAIAEETGGMLMALPQKMGTMNREVMSQMFKAMPYFSNWQDDTSSFVYVYHYKPSERLGDTQYTDDGFDLDSEEVSSFFTGEGKTIPGFGVTFAKQNQSFFTNLSLNTENAAVTEASIAATGYIASKGSSLPRSTTLFGQDLYRVRTSYSYQCEFDMMGNMQVMPLMYFQLNNIPFWRGAYMIYKVSHQIVPGNMTTHVAGFRINKYALPLTDGSVITTKRSYGSRRGSIPGVYVSDKEWPVPTDPSIDNPDFDPKNVTNSNPIICLIPAHGPNYNSRTAEWYWSNDVVDRIYKLLSEATYIDVKTDDKYKYNPQKCNKDGAHTTHTTCEMTQVEGIIKSYGSNKVIAFTPHWGNNSKRSCIIYYGGQGNDGDMKVYDGSKQFASILSEKTKDFIENKNLHQHATPGMFIDNTKNPSSVYVTTSKNSKLKELTLACPTIAAEFWSDGYPPTEACHKALTRTALQTTSEWSATTDDGIYKLSQGWLMSDEGKNSIAMLAFDAITAFISTLPYNKENDTTLTDSDETYDL